MLLKNLTTDILLRLCTTSHTRSPSFTIPATSNFNIIISIQNIKWITDIMWFISENCDSKRSYNFVSFSKWGKAATNRSHLPLREEWDVINLPTWYIWLRWKGKTSSKEHLDSSSYCHLHELKWLKSSLAWYCKSRKSKSLGKQDAF